MTREDMLSAFERILNSDLCNDGDEASFNIAFEKTDEGYRYTVSENLFIRESNMTIEKTSRQSRTFNTKTTL